MSESQPGQPEQFDRIVEIADHLINLAGTKRVIAGGITVESVLIAVDDPEMVKLGDAVLPTIKITRPADSYTAEWSHEITYGLIDSGKSKHVHIGKKSAIGRRVTVSSYNGDNSYPLSQSDANKLIFDLETQIPPEDKIE